MVVAYECAHGGNELNKCFETAVCWERACCGYVDGCMDALIKVTKVVTIALSKGVAKVCWPFC